jgi:septum formation protein
VYTGLCIVDTPDNSVLRGYEKTSVTFKKLTDNEIQQYLARINPLDKAGAYAIQGEGALIVAGITGCYYNVVGFPIARLEQMLLHKGVSLFDYMKKDAGVYDRY